MNLTDYFENTEGMGILATSDSDGNVDLAIYAHPHMVDDETVVFIMADKLNHANLQTNPKAAYMFKENTKGYRGKRFYLQKIRDCLRMTRKHQEPHKQSFQSYIFQNTILDFQFQDLLRN